MRCLLQRAGRAAVVLACLVIGACESETVRDLPAGEPASLPDPAEVDAVVFLLGDGGAAVTDRSPVLHALREDVERWSEALGRDSAVSVVYPGDIVYPLGVREPDHPDFEQDTARLWNQIRLVSGPAAQEHATLGLFLAGNHDWGNASGAEGTARLKNLERHLRQARADGPHVALLPAAGEPGPVIRDLRQNIRLVFMDTHWFLQARSDAAQDAFFERVTEALVTAGDRHVVMVQHHPYTSAGPHGALLPGPELLGIPFLLKKTGTLVQDLESPAYDEFLRRLQGTFIETGRPPFIFAAGHDHSLQVLTGRGPFDPTHILVSGSGSKVTSITPTAGMRYGAARPGYMMLVFKRTDAVDLFVVAGDPDRLTCDGLTMSEQDVADCMAAGTDSMDIAYSETLAEADGEPPPALALADSLRPSTPWWDPRRLVEAEAPLEPPDSAPLEPEETERLADGPPPAVPRRTLLPVADSVVAEPGRSYPANGLERLLLGDLNRHLWDLEVPVPVLDLDSLGGGVTPEEVSGGKQTLGLRLHGDDGVVYQFRSIVKDGSGALPDALADSPLRRLLQDQMAAQFPLAAMVVAALQEAAGVQVARPSLVVLPDHERLGPYREALAGRMGWIEMRPDHDDDGVPSFAGSDRVTDTDGLYDDLRTHPSSHIDGDALLRARLVDMLVGDWDRHPDQWMWAAFPDGEGTRWLPIPRDRDWAFARIDGLLPRLAGWLHGGYIGFSDEYPDVARLTHQSESMERRLLGEMSRVDYLRVAREMRAALTDSVLAAAVDRLPEAYLAVERTRLLEALGGRRDELLEIADEWYRLRAREVDIHGAAGPEVVELEHDPFGDLTVRIRAGDDDGPVRFLRTFQPGQTERIRLHLTAGEDRVVEVGAERESEAGERIEVERVER